MKTVGISYLYYFALLLMLKLKRRKGNKTRSFNLKALLTAEKKSRNRDGPVVEHLPPMQASHQCGSGSIPRLGVKCGMSLLLVPVLAPRGFSAGTPVFQISKFQFDLEFEDHRFVSRTVKCHSPSLNKVYLFIH